VGDGSQRAKLQELASGIRKIRFVEPVSAQDYPLILAAADILLVNEREGAIEMSLPSKLTSYFAAGRPVLGAVPTEGWTAAVLSESGAARQVQPGDSEALLNAVLVLKDDPPLRRMLATRGLAYATQKYDKNAALHRYECFLQELLNEPR